MVSLNSVSQDIVQCQKCPRLRKYCAKIAKEKKKQFISETYWGKPVSGWGDPRAQLIVVGLAPAAHGANRTGRMFTGDRSGLWLYQALFENGFSNQPKSVEIHDGLLLKNVYVTSIVKCAPPLNKPSPAETTRCLGHLRAELALLKNKKVYLALGQFAFQHLWNILKHDELVPDGLWPKFFHGKVMALKGQSSLIMSFHPSQQNTFTGRLTHSMFDSIFKSANKLL